MRYSSRGWKQLEYVNIILIFLKKFQRSHEILAVAKADEFFTNIFFIYRILYICFKSSIMKKLYTLVLLALLCFRAAADTEPANNYFLSADNINLNDSAVGDVTSGNDYYDYYKLVTTADGNITLGIVGSTTDFIYVTLFDNDTTTTLGSVTIPGSVGAIFSVNGLAAGTYYVMVGQLTNGANAYTLMNAFDEEFIVNDSEPNDTISTALSLPVNSTTTGHIGFRSNGGSLDISDFYQIVTPADGNLEFTILGTEASYLYLHLYDSDGTTQLNANNNAGTTGVTLTTNGLAAGTYYLRVAAYNTTYYNGYTLTDTLMVETTPNDPEPNDSTSTALTLPVNGTVTGHIGFLNNGGSLDVNDYYQIVTTADGNLEFTLTGTEASYLYLHLFDSDGTTQLNASSNAGTTGVTLVTNGLAAGTYYIRIAAFNTTYYNGYTLSDTLIAEVPVNDIEPNDTTTTASIFVSNSTTSGHIGYRFNGGAIDEFDYWKLTTISPGTIDINFVGTQSSFMYINLYNSSGTSVAVNNGTGTVNLNATGQPAGDYFLRIATFNTPYYNGYSITNTITSGIPTIKTSEQNITLSPNPASDYCFLHFNMPIKTPAATISIMDLSGKICYAEYVSLAGSKEFALPIAKLENGVYLVEVKMGDRVERGKVVVGR